MTHGHVAMQNKRHVEESKQDKRDAKDRRRGKTNIQRGIGMKGATRHRIAGRVEVTIGERIQKAGRDGFVEGQRKQTNEGWQEVAGQW